MTEELFNFLKNVSIAASKIQNQVPSNWVISPHELIAGLDKENISRYRVVNNNAIYKAEILEKYKDKMLGHALNPTTSGDIFLMQYDRENHIQFLVSMHPVKPEKFGLKTLLFTKGGEVYEKFIKDNEELEEKINDRRFGFGVAV